MPILDYKQLPEALLIEMGDARMRIIPYNDKVIRIQYTKEEDFSAKASMAVVGEPDAETSYNLEDHGDELIFLTAQLNIRINKQSGSFSYYDAGGCLLTSEPARGGKTLESVDVFKSVFDESSNLDTGQGADGLRVRAENIRKTFDRKAYRTKLEFEWADGEALYGLGSHEEGMFNLRGQHQYLYQQNMKAVVPILVSTRGYGIFLDSYSLIMFHDDAFGSYLSSEVDDELDYYFICGPEMDEIVSGVRFMTGKAPMLPKWALGYVQSKERYTSQEELVATVREYRERRLPIDCIVLDWKSWTGELWGQKTLDPDRFPEPGAMTEQLHAMNTRLMVSIWPIMNPESDNHKEMLQHDGLLGNRATYDAFQEKARRIYWKQANEGLFSNGVDAWWCDCTEPFEADWQGAVKPGPEERMIINSDEAKLYLDPELINAYSLLHSRGIYEGQRAESQDKRVVNLTRSAYAGQHRYGTVTWSGDISANWDTMRKQIPDGLNFCATGSPYWTLDIGGFFVQNKPDLWFWSGDYDDGVNDLGYRELYVRWFQYAAFLPLFRSHGTDTPREIWQFGGAGEPFHDALLSFLELRYKMMPYMYSLVARIYRDDYTIMRALPFDFRQDAATYDVDDQFMFGPALLVNPVTRPMYYDVNSKPIEGSVKTRSVYLPHGSKWIDFWENRVYEGGQNLEAEAPLERIPLFVRSGSILPMKNGMQFADDRSDGRLYVRIYGGQSASFDYYEDEGDNYRYESGEYATISMDWNEETRMFTLGDRKGSYPGMANQIDITILLHEPGADGHSITLADKPVIYAGKKHEIAF
ncbi:TIM-barrel domain-containing protein [Paenibacillus luteus]|uniref:glycoside hydrolase family 31 protein n=1 Tax=Paenibacillus luteus TaxID=2545753 RepID=UPI001143B644|nr:TIM-barrel domain-containing protein [Paenibacillus luteus]